MGITVLEFCKECEPLMYLNLINDYTSFGKTIQVKDIIEHESDWLGMEITGNITSFFTYIINDSITSQPVPVLSLHYR